MSQLANLARQALLGTDKRPPVWPEDGGTFGQLVRELAHGHEDTQQNTSGLDAALCVLRIAGALAVCAKAGAPAALKKNLAGACEEEKHPHIQDVKISELLLKIFTEGPLLLQQESLNLIEARKLLLPPRLLPHALALAKATPSLRPSISFCIGGRGHWLAAQNAEWNIFAQLKEEEKPSSEIWEHGNLAQRTAYLTQIRMQDPAQARSLLSQSLPGMDPRERVALLETLWQGLSMDDENLLESLLQDRSKEVRQLITDLLAHLPDSRFVQRMMDRLRACLKTGTALAIDPPETFGADWKRDALEEKLPAQQDKDMGQRAWWLYQIARHVPLAWWTHTTGLSATELFQWLKKTDWDVPLFRSWIESLRRDTSETAIPWARTILSRLPEKRTRGLVCKTHVNAFELIKKLPATEREQCLLVWFGLFNEPGNPTHMSDLLEQLLEHSAAGTHALSREVSRELSRCLHGWVKRQDHRLPHFMDDFACLLHPEVMHTALQAWPVDQDNTPLCVKAKENLFATLEQRQSLHQFFGPIAI